MLELNLSPKMLHLPILGVIENFLKNLSYQISKKLTETCPKYHEKQSHFCFF